MPETYTETMFNETDDQEIVSRIIDSARVERGEFTVIYTLSFGNKELKLKCDPKIGQCEGFIENTNSQIIEGQTTLLYKAAKHIIEQMVEDTGQQAYYEIMTDDDKMVQWASTKGQEIFEWTKVERLTINPKRRIFIKYFYPKNNSGQFSEAA